MVSRSLVVVVTALRLVLLQLALKLLLLRSWSLLLVRSLRTRTSCHLGCERLPTKKRVTEGVEGEGWSWWEKMKERRRNSEVENWSREGRGLNGLGTFWTRYRPCAWCMMFLTLLPSWNRLNILLSFPHCPFQPRWLSLWLVCPINSLSTLLLTLLQADALACQGHFPPFRYSFGAHKYI